MRLPLQVTFRNCPHSDAVETAIQNKANHLERYYERIVGCRVMVEVPHQHHRKGKLYHIRIDLSLPGEEIVVGRSPALHSAHQDIYIAVRDAFDAVGRMLQEWVRRRRTKRHCKYVAPNDSHLGQYDSFLESSVPLRSSWGENQLKEQVV